MPMTIRLAGNRQAPGFDCDHCGRPIAIPGDGNYHWDRCGAPAGAAMFFTHRPCRYPFERSRPGVDWGAAGLDTLLLHPAGTLKPDRSKAEAVAALMDGWGLPAF